nr:uncharacterized protein family (UPF0051) [uncultured bacterium]
MAGLRKSRAVGDSLELLSPLLAREQVLQQWHQLYSDNGNSGSLQAEQHWQAVQRLGLPSSRDEQWKHTGLEGLLEQRFLSPQQSSVTMQQVRALELPLDAWRLVFVDGVFQPQLSDREWGPYEVEVEGQFDRGRWPVPIQPDVFLHLTEAMAGSRVLVGLAQKTQSAKALYLLHIASSSSVGLSSSYSSCHFEVGEGASATIVEHYASLVDALHFTGTRTSITVGEKARVNHQKLAFEASSAFHIGHSDLHLRRAAQVHSQSFLLGAGFCRHRTNARFDSF